jgi:hypothetical protein
MSKAKDFTQDLADVSQTIDTDVDAIIKLVRQKDGRVGESNPSLDQPPKTNSAPAANDSCPSNEPTQDSPRPAKRKLTKVRTKTEPPLSQQVVLENVTTRLRRETNELLTEVALRQKLKKIEPATRQDIIEVALQDWFRRNGYFKSSVKESD